MADIEEYEMMVKIILIGDSGVGKTNIMSKFLKNQFMEESKATIGVEFGSKLFNHEGHKIKAQIWDTAGQEKYKAITGAYYKGSKGALVVYDITQKKSFENIEKWVNDLKVAGDPKITIILIGNKSDLENLREVQTDEGEKFVEENNLNKYIEVSAKSGFNAQNIFIEAAKILYDDYLFYNKNNDISNNKNNETSEININNRNKKKSKCC